MKTILCVEDEQRVLRNNQKTLREAGYAVLCAENLAEAREHLSKQKPSGIILDIMLPDGNGLDFLKELRAGGNQVPVLMLTAWNTDADIARGLDLGADDYIGKPFGYDVLLSRVRKMLAQAQRVPEHVTKGRLRLDIPAMTAAAGGVDLLLTQKEFSLLLLFVQHEAQVLEPEFLYERVWNAPMGDDKRTLQKHISALKKKLADANFEDAIHQVYGKGYYFQCKDRAEC